MPASIAKPVPAPTKKRSLDDILDKAEKKSDKSSHIVYPQPLEQASHWLKLKAQYEESKRELDLIKDQILAIVKPWHEETCAKRKSHEGTVEIHTATGNLRMSFQHRYDKIPKNRREELRNILGTKYDLYFKKAVTIKVKKDIADDPDKLEEMVMDFIDTVGEEKFYSLFEVEQSLTPTKVFTETTCQLPAETRQALQAAGVKQIVAFAAAK